MIQWKNWGIKSGAAVVMMAAMVGCAPAAAPQAVSPLAGESVPAASSAAESPLAEGVSETFDDPFAYCAAVGTIDEPDDRYVGEELPDAIAEGVRSAWGSEDVDLDVFRIGTVWRCMDNQVYACNVGANLPCLAQGDESREPTQPMADFCTENPGSDFIPAVVTGRATVFNWSCDDTEPVIVDQYTEVDSRGFMEFIWFPLTETEQ